MIVIDKTIISDEIAERYFVCDLMKCKGVCCVEGDAGAPLTEDETYILEDIVEKVAEYLPEESLKVLEEQGAWITDEDGDYVTPTLANNKECVYAFYDQKGILKCGIEQAWIDKKINFRKPISCHLYPIIIDEYDEFEAVNFHYNRKICTPACEQGETLKVPLYKFLAEPLKRKYGEVWYNQLVRIIESNEGNS
jgi:hypothetical protein